jgi:hypothetical protein
MLVFDVSALTTQEETETRRAAQACPHDRQLLLSRRRSADS